MTPQEKEVHDYKQKIRTELKLTLSDEFVCMTIDPMLEKLVELAIAAEQAKVQELLEKAKKDTFSAIHSTGLINERKPPLGLFAGPHGLKHRHR